MSAAVGNPTAAQAVVLLNMLGGHRFRWSLEAFSECWRAGWVVHRHAGHALTPSGGEALAACLLRDFSGPVEVVPTWLGSPMTDDEARIMIALIAGRDPYLVKVDKLVSVHLDAMWRKLWIDAHDRPSPRGRDALAAYLLRGWRP